MNRKDIRIKELEGELAEVKKQLPLKTYRVETSLGCTHKIKAHGFTFQYDHSGTVIFWVHPHDNVAIFLKPIFIKEDK